jgi:CRP-like cAMP-binding protein
MTDSVADLLQRVPLFSSLASDKLSAVARRLRPQRFGKHQEILRADDTSTDVFFVLSGRIEVRNYSENGREFVFAISGAGGTFGEFAAIDGRPRAASVVALEDCLVCRMGSAEFLLLLRENFDITLELLKLLTAKLRVTSGRQLELVTLSCRDRLLGELARLADAGVQRGPEVTIEPAPTHNEIAALVGSHREVITKELNRLEVLGYVRVSRKQIVILDMPRFRDDLLSKH